MMMRQKTLTNFMRCPKDLPIKPNETLYIFIVRSVIDNHSTMHPSDTTKPLRLSKLMNLIEIHKVIFVTTKFRSHGFNF